MQIAFRKVGSEEMIKPDCKLGSSDSFLLLSYNSRDKVKVGLCIWCLLDSNGLRFSSRTMGRI
jgi:hypothetical protein